MKIIPPLEPCPFCGGIPTIKRCGNQKEFWYGVCFECFNTPIDYCDARVNQADAAKVYNDRAQLAKQIIRKYNQVVRNKNED